MRLSKKLLLAMLLAALSFGIMTGRGDKGNEPRIRLIIHRDHHSGYNLELKTEYFSFTPENASKKNVSNQGHAHVYVNGKKITRIYSPWYHLPFLPDGTHTVKVVLSGNNHDELLGKNHELIADESSITVPEPGIHE